MAAADLTAQRLREVLEYDPASGAFTWRMRVSQRSKPGMRAGTHCKTDGYRRIQIDGAIYQEHRLAVLYVTGQWPPDEVDHRNGVRSENRWRNLRVGDKRLNMQNKRAGHAGSATGLLGVYYHSARDRYIATIGVGKRRVWLGTFKTPEAAHATYVEAKRRLHPGCTL